MSISSNQAVSKSDLEDYLFTFPHVMMLFNIAPAKLVPELLEFNTQAAGQLTF